MMVLSRAVRSLAAACLASLFASSAWAQVEPTPARYFECQIAARNATAVGLEERRALLSNSTASARDHSAAEERARRRVEQAFAACGYSANALGAYAHRNYEQLQAWLSANPGVQSRLDAASARVAALSAQMSSPARQTGR